MTGFAKFLFVLFGIAAALSLVGVMFANRVGAIEKKAEVKINNQIIIADIVKSAGGQAKGLSGRDKIGINEGMLFVYEKPVSQGIWMKGMKFAIDVIWISGNKIVGVTENIQPEPGVSEAYLKIYTPPEQVDKILEIAAGRAKLLNAQVGNSVLARPLIRGVNM